MRDSTVLAVSYLVHYGTLLQNATSITYDKALLEDAAVLLQTATIITTILL